jgi:tRNA isopentenyl-2-thiomethyl-A-37 hydroxylase MiaE
MGNSLAPLNSPPYGAKLKAQIRHQEPDRLLDSLLISALIEARSHERLGLLGEYCPDPDLGSILSRFNGFRSPSLWYLLAISTEIILNVQ